MGAPRLFEWRDGADVPVAHAPRPFLHPVHTLAGVRVTDAGPADHPWHLGFGFAVPDVDGTNTWGGGTYVRGRGYQDRNDHGRQRVDRIERTGSASDGASELGLTWIDRHGEPVLEETRAMAWRVLDDRTWQLDVRSALRTAGVDRPAGADHSAGPDRPVSLGSPGSRGRAGAGYGGWFWRFADCRGIAVRTEDATGEDAVNGSRAPWLAWTATFEAGDATLVFSGAAPDDPWFVRAAEYPGVGSAIAWDEAAMVAPGEPFVRSLRVVVADGRRDPEAVLALTDR